MSSSSFDNLRRLPSLLWRCVRAVYYWPGQIVLHLIRLARRQPDDWYRITAPWIVNRPYPAVDESKRRTRPASWHRFSHQFTFADEHVRFDIDYARRAGDVKVLALIFFMGMGDCFFATPLLRALKARHADLPILAFASKNAGQVNSPLLGGLKPAALRITIIATRCVKCRPIIWRCRCCTSICRARGTA
jgi:hypothetical protein